MSQGGECSKVQVDLAQQYVGVLVYSYRGLYRAYFILMVPSCVIVLSLRGLFGVL